jgi:hypothetical protein
MVDKPSSVATSWAIPGGAAEQEQLVFPVLGRSAAVLALAPASV